MKEFNLAAERTYGLKQPSTECFFRFIHEYENENVSKNFVRALNDESVQFEYKDVYHRHYSASFVPIGHRTLGEDGNVKMTKR